MSVEELLEFQNTLIEFQTDDLILLGDQIEEQAKNLHHIQGQMDMLHHSVYVTNEYLLFSSVTLALIASLLMFLTGFILVRGRGK